MASHMAAVCKLPEELSVEERGLLTTAFEHSVGSRLAALRCIDGCEEMADSAGCGQLAQYAREYCSKLEQEVMGMCGVVLEFLDGNLIAKATTIQSKVAYLQLKADCHRHTAEASSGGARDVAFESARLAAVSALSFLSDDLFTGDSAAESEFEYLKARADCCRYIAEVSGDEARDAAAESARLAHEKAFEAAEGRLAAAHPARLGLALSFSVFQYEVLGNLRGAC
eukprot:5718889-Lingulodinium_polyedra.AAC.1